MDSDSMKLSKLQLDALAEVMSIGMGHASTALSQLINEKIGVKLSSLELLPLSTIPHKLGDESVLSTGVYLRITGGLSGTTLLVFPRESALFVADIISNKTIGTTTIIGKEDRSGIEELGSIITASFLNAMSDFLDIKLCPSTPVTVFDVSSAIVRFVLIGINKKIDYGMLVRVDFVSSMGIVAGNFMLLLDSDSLDFLVGLLDKRIQKNRKKPVSKKKH
jgi:chemotaxis protein CheC